MNRRAFLAESATVVIAASGGCAAFENGERDGVVLSHVELGNATDEPQQFDVLVTHDDEVVHWSLHAVEAGGNDQDAGGDVIDLGTPDDHGRVEVHVRVDDEWASTDFDTDRFAGERVIAVVTYGMSRTNCYVSVAVSPTVRVPLPNDQRSVYRSRDVDSDRS